MGASVEPSRLALLEARLSRMETEIDGCTASLSELERDLADAEDAMRKAFQEFHRVDAKAGFIKSRLHERRKRLSIAHVLEAEADSELTFGRSG